MVEIIRLFAEGAGAAGIEQNIEDGAVGRPFAFHAVIIAVEDAGVPLFHQQDQSVRQRFEPRFDLRFE